MCKGVTLRVTRHACIHAMRAEDPHGSWAAAMLTGVCGAKRLAGSGLVLKLQTPYQQIYTLNLLFRIAHRWSDTHRSMVCQAAWCA